MVRRRKWLLLAIGVVSLLLTIAYLLYFTNKHAGEELARKETPANDLSWDVLRNAEYPSEFSRAKTIRLANGAYEEEIAPGSATKLKVQLVDIGAFGYLNGDRAHDAAVILVSDPGGSGTFIHLVAVLNEDGLPRPLKPVLLGDRVAIRAVAIEANKVSVRMRVRGPSDPMVRLTREVSRTYVLSGEGLALESESTEDLPSLPPEQFPYQPETVEVTPGSSPKTVDGTLKPGGIANYVLRADAGQRLSLGVNSLFRNAVLSVFGLDDSVQLVSRNEYMSTWDGIVPTSQDYAIKVITLAGNDLKYTLSIQLTSLPTPTPVRVPSPEPTRTPTPVPITSSPAGIPTLVQGNFKPVEHPLAELSPDAAQLLATRDDALGCAVVNPLQNTIYVENADQQLEMASVIKVLVMLTVIDRATQEHRYVGDDELALLWPMITESDNDSTTYLWNSIGGGAGVSRYLSSIGATGIKPYNGPYYGTSVASARAMSLVMTRLAFGDLLDDHNRKLATEMLIKVVPSQRWGIPSKAETQRGHADTVGLKNGWYEEERGWRVNSVGFIVPQATDQPSYAIACLTNLQPSLRYGIDTIERSAALIHARLHP